MNCSKCKKSVVPSPNYRVMCLNNHIFCTMCARNAGGKCAICDAVTSVVTVVPDVSPVERELWLRQQQYLLWINKDTPEITFLQPDMTRMSCVSMNGSGQSATEDGQTLGSGFSGSPRSVGQEFHISESDYYSNQQISNPNGSYQNFFDETSMANLVNRTDSVRSKDISVYFEQHDALVRKKSSKCLLLSQAHHRSHRNELPPEKFRKSPALNMQNLVRQKLRSETYSIFETERTLQGEPFMTTITSDHSSSQRTKDANAIRTPSKKSSFQNDVVAQNCPCGSAKSEFRSVSSSTNSTPRLLPELNMPPSVSRNTEASETVLKLDFYSRSKPEVVAAMYAACEIDPPKAATDELMQFVQEKFAGMSMSKVKNLISEAVEADGRGDSGAPIEEHHHPEMPSAVMRPGDFFNIPGDEDEDAQSATQSDFDFEIASIETTSEWSNALRAFYIPPMGPDGTADVEPLPQFQHIAPTYRSCDSPAASHRGASPQIYNVNEMNICRHPLCCPVSTCQKPVFVSGFTRHFKVDHASTPVESIEPGKCKNFFIDPKVSHVGVIKCQILYLVSNRIRGLGSGQYQDFLPILVMSTKVNLLELCCSPDLTPDDRTKKKYRASSGEDDFLMVWLTGLGERELLLHYTLAVWADCGPIPICHCVHSGVMYSIRAVQTARSLYESGQVLLLSPEQVRLLTNNGRYMINFQIGVN